MNEEITVITDEGPLLLKKKDVQGLIVKLSGAYYLKDSDLVTRVEGLDKKWRFYRKKSPLITPDEDIPGAFVLKEACYQTEDGVYLKKTSPKVVKLNDKYYRKEYTTKVKDVVYLKSDPLIVEYTQGKYILKEDAAPLSERLYGEGLFWPKENTLLTKKGDVIRAQNAQRFVNGETGGLDIYHNNDPECALNCITVTHDFIDVLNPQENRLINHVAFAKDANNFEKIVILSALIGLTIVVHKSKVKYFNQQIEDFILPRKKAELEELRLALNKKYTDWDVFENIAPIFHIVKEPLGGKVNVWTASTYGRHLLSDKFKFTGGLDYMFGVEVETSQGALGKDRINSLDLACVGDRSIGAYEYVTSPSQGDDGINRLKETFIALNQHCLVDDRCGIHIHVGRQTKGTFNKSVLLNLLKLGILIEEELYQTLPLSRHPTLYHCHSIKRWRKINTKNYGTYMGAYIFGTKEWWLPAQEVGTEWVEPFFNFEAYKLGPERNKNNGIHQWQAGRYKWLNLIHAFHKEGHGTVELRIFPGTTRFEKAYYYVLFSLAFVHVAENCPNIIKKGVTLDDISNAAYAKYPAVRNALNAFHKERKEKFNRTKIYPELDLDFLK